MGAPQPPADRGEKKVVRPDIAMLPNKVPKPEEIVMVPGAVLRATIKVGKALKDSGVKWAVGGDAGEIMKGVNLTADHVEIVTTRDGTDAITKTLSAYVTKQPSVVERKLERRADINAQLIPVYVRSHYAELDVDGVRVEIYGEMQFKVGEWDWGDPLDYEPDHVYLVGTKIPLLPLRLKSELALGLGWLDRVELISDAVIRGQHRH